MSQAELILEQPPIRSEQWISSSLPVLITVPRIKLRPSAGDRHVARPHTRIPRRSTHQGRRRLRREVRFAGCALLALIPITSVYTLRWSSRPDRILACSISDPQQTATDGNSLANAVRLEVQYQSPQPTIASPEAIALSIDRVVAIPSTGSEAPVIVPGYLLPDDSREDAVHEGS
jgi:hypothetical protein